MTDDNAIPIEPRPVSKPRWMISYVFCVVVMAVVAVMVSTVFDAMNFPNKHYLDLHHLNYKGSKQFTTLLNGLIDNNLLNSENKQTIIENAIIEFNKTTN